MKTRILLILLVCAGAEIFAQEAGTSNCPLGLVVETDGKTDEWPMEWIEDTDKQMSYNVCTDDNNLYVRMKTNVEDVRRKIAAFGLTLWMDPNGKKKKKLGLRFPTGAEGTERLMAMKETVDYSKFSSSERAEFQKQLNKTLIADVEMMEIFGLTEEPLTSTRSGITNGIRVAIISNEEGIYVYEAIIPFRAFRLSKSAIVSLGVGFETGKYVPPKQKQSNAPPPVGGVGGARGYGYGAGYGGNYGQSRAQPLGPMGSSTAVWTAIKIK